MRLRKRNLFIIIVSIIYLVFSFFYIVQKSIIKYEEELNKTQVEKDHIPQVVDELTILRIQLAEEQDPYQRQQIVEHIKDLYAYIDPYEISVTSIRHFLIDIRAGDYDQYLEDK